MLDAIKIYFSLFITFIVIFFSIKLLKFKTINVEYGEYKKEGIISLYLICISYISVVINLSFAYKICENYMLTVFIKNLFTLSPVIIYGIIKKEKLNSMGISSTNFIKSFNLGIISGITFLILIYLFERKNDINIYSLENYKIFLEYFIVAVSEEILFRGFLQNKLVKWLGNMKGVILAALIFSLFHFPQRVLVQGLEYSDAILYCFALFPLSLIFGYIMHKSQNIIGISIFHTFINYTNRMFNI